MGEPAPAAADLPDGAALRAKVVTQHGGVLHQREHLEEPYRVLVVQPAAAGDAEPAQRRRLLEPQRGLAQLEQPAQLAVEPPPGGNGPGPLVLRVTRETRRLGP